MDDNIYIYIYIYIYIVIHRQTVLLYPRSDCPMDGLCNFDNTVYQAIIYPKEDISDKKYYIGVSSTNFKIRYGNHKYSFSHEHQKNQTALSKHWGLKNKGLTPDI